MRLIDADVMMDAIDATVKQSLGKREVAGIATMGILACAVRAMPTIDAEPVRHGRWVWREDWGHSSISEPPELLDAYWICSACGTDLLQYLKSHFPDIPSYTECSEEVPPTLERCPSCGAKMDGGASDG